MSKLGLGLTAARMVSDKLGISKPRVKSAAELTLEGVSIIDEYQLIKQKKSKLSATCRRMIVEIVDMQIAKVEVCE